MNTGNGCPPGGGGGGGGGRPPPPPPLVGKERLERLK